MRSKSHLLDDTRRRGVDSQQVRPKAELIRVVQLTDIHIDVRYAQVSDYCDKWISKASEIGCVV